MNDDCCLRTAPINSSQDKLISLRKRQMNFRGPKSERGRKYFKENITLSRKKSSDL
jgi:hypothetical protein